MWALSSISPELQLNEYSEPDWVDRDGVRWSVVVQEAWESDFLVYREWIYSLAEGGAVPDVADAGPCLRLQTLPNWQLLRLSPGGLPSNPS